MRRRPPLPPRLRRLLRRLNVFDPSRPTALGEDARASEAGAFQALGKGPEGSGGG